MIILDTHAWIWWVSQPDSLSKDARFAIDYTNELGICPISCWEIATKFAKGKLSFDRDLRLWIKQALQPQRIQLLPISSDIAVTAGLLGQEGFHGDPADRLIVATALHYGVEVITKDNQIRAFKKVRSIW